MPREESIAPGAIEKLECVILLHGLSRSSDSMAPMAEYLETQGYGVLNIDYPSRTKPIAELSVIAVGESVKEARSKGFTRIHFVTHSLGGILVREYLSKNSVPELGRVVMLGPPNGGSEVVDTLRGWRIFKAINGPAGSELGTGQDSVPKSLGPVAFELGVIAGDWSINWINSSMIPGPDDGKVSVENTKVVGMHGHLVLHVTHPLMMRNREVMDQVRSFLETGSFEVPDRSE